mmetsp:Transcript_10046/g.23575  ORF Transcript_10046/g.23575 Transcript_10046/m.23575 type:complete len:80 (+) Transcript_10046:1-240(+)
MHERKRLMEIQLAKEETSGSARYKEIVEQQSTERLIMKERYEKLEAENKQKAKELLEERQQKENMLAELCVHCHSVPRG